MRLATLKKDLYFRRGGPRISGVVLPKGATIQVVKYDLSGHLPGKQYVIL